jgi:AcrR family transcriptional regulator
MAIIVEHEKRQQQILKKALDVFVEEGFENATYQKIADYCKITRTTLYLYFHNKNEIFKYSIKQLLSDTEQDILSVKENTSLDYPNKIKKVLLLIFNRLEANSKLLSVITEHLLSLYNKQKQTKTSKNTPDARVRRRTIRLRRILASMIIEGGKSGQFKKIKVSAADNLFYGLIEAAIFHLVVLKRENLTDLEEAVDLAVNNLTAEAPKQRLKKSE